jgi:hypothetical protein
VPGSHRPHSPPTIHAHSLHERTTSAADGYRSRQLTITSVTFAPETFPLPPKIKHVWPVGRLATATA